MARSPYDRWPKRRCILVVLLLLISVGAVLPLFLWWDDYGHLLPNGSGGRRELDISMGAPAEQPAIPGAYHVFAAPVDLEIQDEKRLMITHELYRKEYIGRRIPDFRHASCKKLDFPNLEEYRKSHGKPFLSVIIIFCDEPLYNLLRTIHSVLNETPPDILAEIALVDDGSVAAHIRGEDSFIALYVKQLPKVKLIRNPTRSGIVGARMLGINESSGRIFAILDSHVELGPAWAEPLVDPVLSNSSLIVMPAIDGIQTHNGKVTDGGIGCVLGMLWRIVEHSFPPLEQNSPRYGAKPSDYVSSPTMAGGIFAAHKQKFLDLGGYDPGITYWGAENLELSFRWWQCGGQIQCSQCSRVAHIFGGFRGYSPMRGSSLLRNKLRSLAVWMDDFGDLSWRLLNQPMMDIGDVEPQRDLRRELECKDFSWFIENVWPEADIHDVHTDVPYFGSLTHSYSDKCLMNRAVSVGSCNDSWMLLRRPGRMSPTSDEEFCLSVSNSRALRGSLEPLVYGRCDEYRPQSQSFSVHKLEDSNPEDKSDLVLIKNDLAGLCIGTESLNSTAVKLLPCDPNSFSQRWKWEKYKLSPGFPYKPKKKP